MKLLRLFPGGSAATKMQEGWQASPSALPVPVIDPGKEELQYISQGTACYGGLIQGIETLPCIVDSFKE